MDILKDLSTLTTISEKDLKSLFDKYEWCIYQNVYEQRLGENAIDIDIEIGHLYILNVDDNLKYKFIPSEKFNENILKTFKGENLLKIRIGKTLASKIVNTYKDMF